MNKPLHKLLYRTLPLEGYLGVVSRLFFLSRRLGLGRRSPATEYLYHLPHLVRPGDTCIDIGANLGYYTRDLSRLTGPRGKVYAVEPVPPILTVLRRNVAHNANVEVLPFALGEGQREVRMANDTPSSDGYFGTGRNFVAEGASPQAVAFEARMRRGSQLFAGLERIDFIKCDVEGYELAVMRDLRPLLEKHLPTVLIETGGDNRPRIIELFASMGYRAYMLCRDREVPLDADSDLDIIFRHAH